MAGASQRNLVMAERIAVAPVHYPFSFVVAGDSGAWPDPTADGIFRQHGETHFVAIDAAPGSVGDPEVPDGDTAEGTEAPRGRVPLDPAPPRREARLLPGRPEDRGSLYHAVQLTITEAGAVGGRVLQAFEPVPGGARLSFGDGGATVGHCEEARVRSG